MDSHVFRRFDGGGVSSSSSSSTSSPKGRAKKFGMEAEYLTLLQSRGDNYLSDHPHESGLVCMFRNYPLNNKNWKFKYAEFRHKTQTLVAADERGQVFLFDLKENIYHIVRTASEGVDFVTFINTNVFRQSQLVLSYTSGATHIVDTNTKEIIFILKRENPNSRIVLIRSNPGKPQLLIVDDIGCVSVWDLNLGKSIGNMDITENIVDIRFECNGTIASVVLENSGVYWYETSNFDLICKVSLPETERQPSFTAYCCCLLSESANSGDSSGSNNYNYNNMEKSNIGRVTRDSAIMLAGDNGLIYQWIVSLLQNADDSYSVVIKLLSVVEIPVKVPKVTSMVSLDPVGCTSYLLKARIIKVALMSSEGSCLLLQGEDIQWNSFGDWRIIAHASSAFLQRNNNTPVDPNLVKNMLTPASLRINQQAIDEVNDALASGAAIKKKMTKVYPPTSSSTTYTSDAMSFSPNSTFKYGCISCGNPYIAVVCVDGSLKIFDQAIFTGFGDLSGQRLRCRKPFSGGDDSATIEFEDVELRDASISDFRGEGGERNEGRKGGGRFRSISGDGSKPLSGGGRSRGSPHNLDRSSVSRKYTSEHLRAQTSKRVEDTKKVRLEKGLYDNKRPVNPNAPTLPKKLGKPSKVPPQVSEAPVDLINMSVFDLSHLTAQEKKVNKDKLRDFIKVHGEFPTKYRTLIWRFLLRLPENAESFRDLVMRGVHEKYETLYEIYPIKSRRVFDRLQNTCSQIAHWSPIFAELPYMPSFIFPFVVVYNDDELACLETVMTLLMFWGYSWNVTFPNPPMHAISLIDSLLKVHDSKLHYHLTKLKASPGLIIWNFMNTLFTEIISRETWFKIMDFLFAFFQEKQEYLYLMGIGILRLLRDSIITCTTDIQVFAFLRSQKYVDPKELIVMVMKMADATPDKMLCPLRNSTKEDVNRLSESISSSSSSSSFSPSSFSNAVAVTAMGEDDNTDALRSLAVASGNALFPLPKGQYPPYDGYPKTLVDWQLQERNRILALDSEVSRKTSVLKSLESAVSRLETDHNQYLLKHRHATETQVSQHKQMMEIEKVQIDKLRGIEEEISRVRINALQQLEKTAQEELRETEFAAQQAHQLLLEKENHMRHKISATLDLQKMKELGETAELAMREKMNTIASRRSREDLLKTVTDSIANKEQQFNLEDLILQEGWKKEDEEMRLKRQMRARNHNDRLKKETLDRVQEEAIKKVEKLNMEREMKKFEVERLRAIRLTKEQVDESKEIAERSKAMIMKRELREREKQASELAQKALVTAKERIYKSVDDAKDRSQRLLEAEEVFMMKEENEKKSMRDKELQEMWAKMEFGSLESLATTEKKLQQYHLDLRKAEIIQRHPKGVSSSDIDPGPSSTPTAATATTTADTNADAKAVKDTKKDGSPASQGSSSISNSNVENCSEEDSNEEDDDVSGSDDNEDVSKERLNAYLIARNVGGTFPLNRKQKVAASSSLSSSNNNHLQTSKSSSSSSVRVEIVGRDGRSNTISSSGSGCSSSSGKRSKESSTSSALWNAENSD